VELAPCDFRAIFPQALHYLADSEPQPRPYAGSWETLSLSAETSYENLNLNLGLDFSTNGIACQNVGATLAVAQGKPVVVGALQPRPVALRRRRRLLLTGPFVGEKRLLSLDKRLP
jgi:hypothetical protein